MDSFLIGAVILIGLMMIGLSIFITWAFWPKHKTGDKH